MAIFCLAGDVIITPLRTDCGFLSMECVDSQYEVRPVTKAGDKLFRECH